MANVKRSCPICGEKDSEFHSDALGGDKVVLQGGKLYCASCGYDASEDEQFIVENQ